MAKALVFDFDGSNIAFEMTKIDRSKLYGYKELEILDEEGQACELATLADDGRTVVGRGGVGLGYLTADGSWCDKTSLQPVNLEGEAITPVPSSFSAPVPLVNRVSLDEYMNHNIRLVYKMEIETDADAKGLIAELRDGAIFKFDYSFRGGLEPDVGFLLTNDAGEIFMLIASATSIDYIGLQQTTSIVADVDDAEGGDEDLMDFGMI